MFLIDTNIFLEILLSQNKKEDCKSFLENNIGKLNITDFTLHSIGVILFRYGKDDVFQKFIEDILPHVKVLSLQTEFYKEISVYRKNFNLDFDDVYQYAVCKCYNLQLVTMDKDFERVKDYIAISFL